MAPSHSRHLLVWTTLPIAVLLSYLWFKRKRVEARSDPGLIEQQSSIIDQEVKTAEFDRSFDQASLEVQYSGRSSPASSSPPPTQERPIKTFSRSLSGVDSAPIDIIFPPELKSAKTSQIVISDEDLDLEIEKIKSMKNSMEFYNKKKESTKPEKSPASVSTTMPPNAGGSTSKKENNHQRVTLQKASPRKTGSMKEEKTKKPHQQLHQNKTPNNKSSFNNTNNNNNNTVNNNHNNKTEMVQKDVANVSLTEKKMGSLKIDTTESVHSPKQQKSPRSEDTTEPMGAAANVTENDIQRQNNEGERDSANHSPCDVMLPSPSLSSISDDHSIRSNDSGKGGSELVTPPSHTPEPLLYEFVIPQSLVGKLIGKSGNSISQIKNKSHTHMLIKKHPDTNTLKLCAIEGTQSEINHALELVRYKFPLKRFPELTLEQVSLPQPVAAVPVLAQPVSIRLIEGINNDTIVSCMVEPNHLFLQQPGHPTFPNLHILNGYMNACYADANSPMLPNPMPDNCICAAFSIGAWYRAVVLSTNSDLEISNVKFLDYGGYANVKNSDLRQIRGDFLLLPFQASECFLSNIRPKGDDGAEWSDDAFKLVADLTQGSMVYTQIVNYTENEIPMVMVYLVLPPQRIICVNTELVNRGYAEWIVDETENTEGAVGGVESA